MNYNDFLDKASISKGFVSFEHYMYEAGSHYEEIKGMLQEAAELYMQAKANEAVREDRETLLAKITHPTSTFKRIFNRIARAIPPPYPDEQ